MCIDLYNVHLYSVKLLKFMVLTVSTEVLHVFFVYVVDFSLEFHTENKHRLFFILYPLSTRDTHVFSRAECPRADVGRGLRDNVLYEKGYTYKLTMLIFWVLNFIYFICIK